jgi:hypothetical protein
MSISNRLKVLTLSNVALTANSSNDKTSVKFPLKVTGENWISWEQQMIPILGSRECLDEHKLPVTTPVNKAYEAIALIQKNLSETLLVKVRPHLDSPLAMWAFLKKEFAGANKQRRASRIQALIRTTINPKEIVEGVQVMVSLIEALGEANGSNELSIQALGITTILNALPIELSYLKADLEALMPEPSLVEVVTRINAEIAAVKNSTPYRSSGQANSATRDTASTPANATCKHCGEKGHYSAKWASCKEHDPTTKIARDQEMNALVLLQLEMTTLESYSLISRAIWTMKRLLSK